MYRDRDFDPDQDLPPNEADLTADLELDTLFNAMSGDDPYIREVVRRAVLLGVQDPDEIGYRQDVLRDCLQHPEVIRSLYAISIEAIQREKKSFRYFRSVNGILSGSVDLVTDYVEILRQLREIGETNTAGFRSEGFGRFFRMLASELDDTYFRTVANHLEQLEFRHGVLVSARLGQGNRGIDHVLRKPNDARRSLREWLASGFNDPFTITIPERDQAGGEALTELRERGINLVANALAQSVDHILSFFQMLKLETAFYLGALNLHEKLTAKGEPVCFPAVAPADSPQLNAESLYDICLSLSVEDRVVGNELSASGKTLVMITGANQGGKSTLLRAIGLAQLMMQAGMFVGAAGLHGSVSTGIFTHYKREEDADMESGKLDEELARLSDIADHLAPGGLVLCNESFASTNEREGSELGQEAIRAMVESGIRVVFVTHLFHLAHWFSSQSWPNALFLRAERRTDGRRTFKIVEGEPQPTSYGEDLYRQVFGTA